MPGGINNLFLCILLPLLLVLRAMELLFNGSTHLLRLRGRNIFSCRTSFSYLYYVTVFAGAMIAIVSLAGSACALIIDHTTAAHLVNKQAHRYSRSRMLKPNSLLIRWPIDLNLFRGIADSESAVGLSESTRPSLPLSSHTSGPAAGNRLSSCPSLKMSVSVSRRPNLPHYTGMLSFRFNGFASCGNRYICRDLPSGAQLWANPRDDQGGNDKLKAPIAMYKRARTAVTYEEACFRVLLINCTMMSTLKDWNDQMDTIPSERRVRYMNAKGKLFNSTYTALKSGASKGLKSPVTFQDACLLVSAINCTMISDEKDWNDQKGIQPSDRKVRYKNTKGTIFNCTYRKLNTGATKGVSGPVSFQDACSFVSDIYCTMISTEKDWNDQRDIISSKRKVRFMNPEGKIFDSSYSRLRSGACKGLIRRVTFKTVCETVKHNGWFMISTRKDWYNQTAINTISREIKCRETNSSGDQIFSTNYEELIMRLVRKKDEGIDLSPNNTKKYAYYSMKRLLLKDLRSPATFEDACSFVSAINCTMMSTLKDWNDQMDTLPSERRVRYMNAKGKLFNSTYTALKSGASKGLKSPVTFQDACLLVSAINCTMISDERDWNDQKGITSSRRKVKYKNAEGKIFNSTYHVLYRGDCSGLRRPVTFQDACLLVSAIKCTMISTEKDWNDQIDIQPSDRKIRYMNSKGKIFNSIYAALKIGESKGLNSPVTFEDACLLVSTIDGTMISDEKDWNDQMDIQPSHRNVRYRNAKGNIVNPRYCSLKIAASKSIFIPDYFQES